MALLGGELSRPAWSKNLRISGVFLSIVSFKQPLSQVSARALDVRPASMPMRYIRQHAGAL
jgi:hypothetical protein